MTLIIKFRVDKEYIGVIDSGVGGLWVLKQLVKNIPDQNYVYFGDNLNAPYGEKSNRRLLELLFNNLTYLSKFNLKAVVVACNTLSVSVMSNLKDLFDFKLFGIYPPTLTPILKGYKTILLSTPKTAQNIERIKDLTIKPLPYLAGQIEGVLNDINSININEHLDGVSKNYDAVILGCTHYELIKNKFFDHFQPQKIYSGTDFTIKMVKEFCKTQKTIEKHYQNEILFVGKNAKINKNFWFSVVKNGFEMIK